jgi:hypothetical protein
MSKSTVTSQKMSPVNCEIILMCMFGSDKDNAWNLRELAYNSGGTWVGNGVVSVKYITVERAYVIRYTFPSK